MLNLRRTLEITEYLSSVRGLHKEKRTGKVRLRRKSGFFWENVHLSFRPLAGGHYIP